MKKRYVISIVTIFIFALSFFAHNNFNKKVSENNNTIGIYLEDDYESNTYTLSDSSDIPDRDYIFNVEKTNEECPNATFSYDSVNNKVQVNSNKSVECNMYFKEDLFQLINYQFLYDGSLGDAEANQMKDITGGWLEDKSIMPIFASTEYYNLTKSYNSNSLYLKSIKTNTNQNYGGSMRTQNLFELNNYIGLHTSMNAIGTASGEATIFVLPQGETAVPENHYSYYQPGGSNPYRYYETIGNSKYLDLSLNFQGLHYIGVSTATAGTANSSVGAVYMEVFYYNIWLTKADDFNKLASRINVTVSSIDNLLNNYSTQLLNNEEAVKYMIKQCTGEFMTKAIRNTTFMTAYRSSPYKSLIDANIHWKKFIDMVS